jgi:hypothetical protein
MLNFAFSPGLNSLREVVSKRNGAEWWSTYGKRPDSLFAGVQVRNTILTLAPGSGKHSTCQQIFSRASRGSMFSTLEYVQLERLGSSIPFRSGVSNELVQAIHTATGLDSSASGEIDIAMRVTGAYWFPALPSIPKVLDGSGEVQELYDQRVSKITLRSVEDSDVALATLVGKLGYLWWSATGDDFHTKVSETTQPRSFAAMATVTPGLLEAAAKVKAEGFKHAFATSNAGWYQSNIRWNAARKVTDHFDRLLLELLDLAPLWRPLNIWYRQVMKSSGENANGVILAENKARAIFGEPN